MKTKDFPNVWKAALTPFAPNYAPALSLESTISEKPQSFISYSESRCNKINDFATTQFCLIYVMDFLCIKKFRNDFFPSLTTKSGILRFYAGMEHRKLGKSNRFC